MTDRIIIKNTGQEANLEKIQATDVLNGELLLVREADKERLYCKNSAGVLTPIHRITDAGDFKVEVNVIEVQKADTIAGDVCTWDGNSKRFFRFVDEGATDDIKNYTPIGVVVVPTSHTDDGTARVMSLASMDYNNPDNGNTNGHIGMAWGGYGSDVPDLPYLTQAPYITNDFTSISGEQQLLGFTGLTTPYFSSDQYTDYPNPYDEGTYFYIGTTSSGKKGYPSPYLTGGAKNEIYHDTSNTGNALADMDGKSNTEKILAVDNGVSTSWQTASTITNNTSSSTNTQPHSTAQCCWRYHTVGTNQGDWYLPSAGELGYLASRWKAIDNSIDKLVSSGVEALVLPVYSNWWSSTEYSSGNAVLLTFYSGYALLSPNYKRSNYYVRAFLAVSPLDQSGVSPSEASNGVYVYANNGKLYNPEEWDTANNDLAIGVAVVTDDCKFAITKGEKSQRVWSEALYGTDVSGLTNYTDPSQALTDFNGENNTAVIRAAASSEDASNNAVHYCYNQTVSISGRGTVHGYLPAFGELRAAYKNKSAVNSAMSLIGGIAMPTSYALWSSTECDSGNVWAFPFDYGYTRTYPKETAVGYAVPIFPLD